MVGLTWQVGVDLSGGCFGDGARERDSRQQEVRESKQKCSLINMRLVTNSAAGVLCDSQRPRGYKVVLVEDTLCLYYFALYS